MTLTTGTPMFTGAGALEGYRVTGGAIQIDGDGLDTSRGGFLNASRVTLTTGTPMFTGAGALEGYRVTGGA
ncbi:hypothetical protein C7E12_22240, partial [Stenotrophomonas maltophilia]